jgi:hypothetical protein
MRESEVVLTSKHASLNFRTKLNESSKKTKKGGENVKKLLLIGLILGLFLSHSYAQMVSQRGETGKGMMGQKEMTDKMMEMMNQMSEMMGKMPKVMMKVTPPPDIRKTMFEIMKDMSQQMMDMSKIMERGAASEKEMKTMQEKMAQMQKKMSELEMK